MAGNNAVADKLVEGDKIVVSIGAVEGGRGNGRIQAAAGTFKYTGGRIVRLDQNGLTLPNAPSFVAEAPQGQAAPQFDNVRYERLINGGEEAAAREMELAYTTAVTNFRDNGGTSLSDRLIKGALAWAKQVHGVKSDGGRGGDRELTVDPRQVTCRPAFRPVADQPGTFLINMAPVWGTR